MRYPLPRLPPYWWLQGNCAVRSGSKASPIAFCQNTDDTEHTIVSTVCWERNEVHGMESHRHMDLQLKNGTRQLKSNRSGMNRTSKMNQKTPTVKPKELQTLQNVARRVKSHSSGAAEVAKESERCLRELQRGPQRGPKTSPKRSPASNMGLKKNEK